MSHPLPPLTPTLGRRQILGQIEGRRRRGAGDRAGGLLGSSAIGPGGSSMHLAQLDLLPGLRGCEDTRVQNAGNSEGPADDGTDLKGVRGGQRSALEGAPGQTPPKPRDDELSKCRRSAPLGPPRGNQQGLEHTLGSKTPLVG